MKTLKILFVLFIVLSLMVVTVSCAQPIDSDGDGWSDMNEMAAGTDPYNVDSDSDGYWDPQDANPLDATIPLKEQQPEVADESEMEAVPEQEPESLPSAEPDEPPTSPATPAISPELLPVNELQEVQEAVRVMMRNNDLHLLPNPVGVPTNDMHQFPDATTKHGKAGAGYVLHLHDFNGDGKPDTNYIGYRNTSGTYVSDAYGNVTQVSSGYD
jgi:hypothetical protein